MISDKWLLLLLPREKAYGVLLFTHQGIEIDHDKVLNCHEAAPVTFFAHHQVRQREKHVPDHVCDPQVNFFLSRKFLTYLLKNVALLLGLPESIQIGSHTLLLRFFNRSLNAL